MLVLNFARHLICILGLVSVITLADRVLWRRYQLEFENLEVFNRPGDIFQIEYARLAKYNDTINVFNMCGNLTREYPKGLKYIPTMYQKMNSNKYSMIPIRLATIDLEQFFKTDVFFMPGFIAASNIPRIWPVKAGRIVIKDYFPDMTNAPLELPGERWRIEHVVTLNNKEMFRLHAFVYINRNI